LKWGDSLKAFKERARKTGVKPAPLLARPKIKRHDVWYLEAFQSLSAARSNGFSGAEPIAISEIVAYLNLEGVTDPQERRRFLNLVQLLDSEWMKFHRERAEAARQAAKRG
jgi:hypothetical protein